MLSVRLAWRNLFRNTRRTLLTCTLITSSLMVIILVDGMVLGMVEVMVGGITHTLEGEAQVNRKGFRENLEPELRLIKPDPITEALKNDERVSGFAPRVMVGGMIASTYNTSGGLIYGVDYRAEQQVSKLKQALIQGSYLTGAKREILIGKLLAELLEVDLGDRIIISAARVGTSDITQELFRVQGIFEFGPEEMDENFAFVNLEVAQAMLGMEGQLHQIAIRFNDPEDAKDSKLPTLVNLREAEVEALGWLDLQPSVGGMIEMSNYASTIVGAVLFVLTSLGVINSMFMSIYERIYEFGVAKAIGTTPGQIISLVLFEAFFLALIACFLGIVLAYGASSYFEAHGVPMGRMEVAGVLLDGNLYTKVEAYQFVVFPVYVTLLTLAAAIYPAIFASRIVPSQALQRAL